MNGRVTAENVFRERLNELICAQEHRMTNQMISDDIGVQCVQISLVYVSQLRTGVRKNPSRKVVQALADYFKVPVGYLYKNSWRDDRNDAQEMDSSTIMRISDLRIKRLPINANGLPPRSIGLLADVSMKFRFSEGMITSPNE